MASKNEKSSRTKGKLVKLWGEHIPIEYYKKIPVGTKQKGSGIYALFKGDKAIYVGLSEKSIRGRLKTHATKDDLKDKWDTFSFYQIRRKKYIKDTESIILRIFEPKNNKNKGKFPKANRWVPS